MSCFFFFFWATWNFHPNSKYSIYMYIIIREHSWNLKWKTIFTRFIFYYFLFYFWTTDLKIYLKLFTKIDQIIMNFNFSKVGRNFRNLISENESFGEVAIYKSRRIISINWSILITGYNFPPANKKWRNIN
jgi:hypothetical protein